MRRAVHNRARKTMTSGQAIPEMRRVNVPNVNISGMNVVVVGSYKRARKGMDVMKTMV